MPGKPYPSDLLRQARKLLDAWSRIDHQLTFGALKAETLAEELEKAEDIQEQLIGLANQLTELRGQRDALHLSIWDTLKRARAGVKGAYGDDSPQYELIGGTRMSEKKSPIRKIVVQE